MFWKAKCKKAAEFLDSYSGRYRKQNEEERQYDVKLVVETVAEMLHIPVSVSITPQETSCCILELITEFEYKQSQDVLFPSWSLMPPEKRQKLTEQDYGKFFEAVYKYKSTEQRWRLQAVEWLSVFRGERNNPLDFSKFFGYLEGYLQCTDSVETAEMRLFMEKSLCAAWGVYLERQEGCYMKKE